MQLKRSLSFVAALALISILVYLCWPSDSLPVPDEINTMILYSIDGRGIESPKPGQPVFHHYPVLGETTVSDADRSAILLALNRGVAQHGGGGLACHWPRHGLRLQGASRTMEYTICFECENIEVFDGDSRWWTFTTAAPQPTLNAVLTRVGVELAPGMIEVR